MPPMTQETILELGREARSVLDEQERVVVEYHPGNGTRYVVAIVNAIPQVRVKDGEIVHLDGRDRNWLVVIENFGTSAVLNMADEPPFPVYLAEKLTHGNITDASAIRLLLAAVAGAPLSGTSMRDAGIAND